jgi:hypothetical protein
MHGTVPHDDTDERRVKTRIFRYITIKVNCNFPIRVTNNKDPEEYLYNSFPTAFPKRSHLFNTSQ